MHLNRRTFQTGNPPTQTKLPLYTLDPEDLARFRDLLMGPRYRVSFEMWQTLKAWEAVEALHHAISLRHENTRLPSTAFPPHLCLLEAVFAEAVPKQLRSTCEATKRHVLEHKSIPYRTVVSAGKSQWAVAPHITFDGLYPRAAAWLYVELGHRRDHLLTGTRFPATMLAALEQQSPHIANEIRGLDQRACHSLQRFLQIKEQPKSLPVPTPPRVKPINKDIIKEQVKEPVKEHVINEHVKRKHIQEHVEEHVKPIHKDIIKEHVTDRHSKEEQDKHGQERQQYRSIAVGTVADPPEHPSAPVLLPKEPYKLHVELPAVVRLPFLALFVQLAWLLSDAYEFGSSTLEVSELAALLLCIYPAYWTLWKTAFGSLDVTVTFTNTGDWLRRKEAKNQGKTRTCFLLALLALTLLLLCSSAVVSILYVTRSAQVFQDASHGGVYLQWNPLRQDWDAYDMLQVFTAKSLDSYWMEA